MENPKSRALNKAHNSSKFKSRAEEIAYNNNPKNFSTKKEKKAGAERMKNWPKAIKGHDYSIKAQMNRDKENHDFQSRTGRAWND